VLAFDATAHSYTLDGRRLPSVTQVLEQLTDFSFVPAATLERSRQLGNAAHRMIELDVTNTLDVDSLTGPLVGYFAQWRAFLAKTGFRVKHCELRLASARYGYAGTLDLLGTFPGDSDDTLIDAKSGAVPKTARPQTAGYSQLVVENGICQRPPKRRALDLKEDSWRLTEPYTSREDWATFLACLTLFRWREQAA
jgi:hypothetical protein